MERLNELEDIEDIEEDVVVSKMSYDAVPWHLDRIDQNYLPLDNQLSFNDRDGPERERRRFCIRARYWNTIERERERGKIDSHVTALDPEEDDLLDLDPDGHGTFCASLIAGKTTGVVPGAKIVSVRVLNSKGLVGVRCSRWT